MMQVLAFCLSLIVMIGIMTALNLSMTLSKDNPKVNVLATLVVVVLFLTVGQVPFLFLGVVGIANIHTKLQNRRRKER